MRYYYTFLLLIISSTIFAQGEANYWYFGQNAGVNFGTTPPTILTDGQVDTLEGCTTISDATGQLLFYTDGSRVFTRNHTIMQNGTGLKGDPSSTSSALIIPQPNTPNIYLIFTVDEPHHQNADSDPTTQDGDGVNDGFMYSVVDMSLNGGEGAVIATQKNIQLITYDTNSQLESLYKCSEKITAVKSDNCDSFWVITHFIDNFYAFEVDNTGVNTTPVISNTGVEVPISGYRRNALGYIKAAPEGDKIAVAHFGFATQINGNAPGKVLLYDFDNTTGTVSNEVELYDGDAPYGVEFSPSGERLYATVGGGNNGSSGSFLLQFDLTLPDPQIAGSGIRIRNENGQNTTNFSAGALQLAPDGRIYRALFDFGSNNGDFLGVIENPEMLGNNASYTETSFRINIDGNRGSRIGLPPFIQSLFAQSINIINDPNQPANDVNLNLCFGDTYTLSFTNIPTATYTWFVDDVQIANTTNSLIVNTSANYRLEIDLNDGSCPAIGVANVMFFDIPTVQNVPLNEVFCTPNTDGTAQIDLSQYTNTIIGTQDPALFQVRYFRSIADAMSNTDELTVNFVTETNPQTIAARIENINNTDCFDTASFDIDIFINPEAFPVAPIINCDNDDDGDDTNGQIMFDLTTLDPTVFNGQDPLVFQITYHTSQTGADNNTDLIAVPQNVILNTTTTAIFARISNIANPNCYDTTEIPVTINLLPTTSDATLIQCDTDNPSDGITLFNLEQALPQVTGGNTGNTITFHLDQINAEMGTNLITNTTSYINTTNNQVLYVRAIDPTTNCIRITTLTLNTVPLGVADIIIEQCDDDGTEDGFYSFDLNTIQNTILTTIPTPLGSLVNFYASENDALLEENSLSTPFVNTTANTQIIYARIENTNNCFGISNITLQVHELPNIEVEATQSLCENESVTLTPAILSGDISEFTYLWSTGETSPTINVGMDGTYTVVVTNINGCEKTRTIEVTLSNPATIESIEIDDAVDNNTVTINVTGLGDYEYAIEVNNELSNYQDSSTFTNVPPGFHRVFIRDKNGCLPITIEDIAVVGFPDFFTPNGDSFNERWNVRGISSTHLGNSLIYIFDRYGKLLTKVSPTGLGWDGVYNKTPMPSSDYWYRVELEDGRILTGSFSLKR